MKNLLKILGSLYCILRRQADTNQRIYFDCHPDDANLVISGGTDGAISMFDITQPPQGSELFIDPFWKSEELYNDCVNGVSFRPLVVGEGNLNSVEFAATSGQRHIEIDPDMMDSNEDYTSNNVSQCDLKLWRYRFESNGQ